MGLLVLVWLLLILKSCGCPCSRGTLPFWRCKRGGYTVLRPVLLNESGVEAFREALVRDARTRGHLATLVHGL
ncbi:uncharacterized protein LOC144169280 isoform X2 [Haemaphysalis longicornis]